MKVNPPILSISGSDSTGLSGIQADIQTIAALGGYALTAITTISLPCQAAPHREQGGQGRLCMARGGGLSPELVLSQVSSIISTVHPKAIKVGLVTDCETVRLLCGEVIACQRLVIAPGIYDADGRQMVGDDVIEAVTRYLVPEALLLMLRCKDAERMLGISIQTDEDMVEAARRLQEMGAQWVLLRGGSHTQGRLTALLYGPQPPLHKEEAGSAVNHQFFTSHNTDGWRRHGVAGALSAAITTRLGMGDDVPTAVRNAHDFIHSQVVYAKDSPQGNLRAIDLYNSFVSLVAANYAMAHDVAFYADRLCITPRYLSQVTDRVVGKPPRQIIADYLLNEAKRYLKTTRLTIQEIADRTGFSSQSLFCKFFKTQQGTSPSEFRSH